MRFVYKFGGTSLGSRDKILQVARFIKAQVERAPGMELVVVVSAMGETTNNLESLARSLNPSADPWLQARLMTLGENISVAALAIALEGLGVGVKCFGAREAGIYARGDPLNGVITYIDSSPILDAIKDSVAIVAGFQGVNDKGEVLALGRGGSDTTAVALGAALGASVKIFTDVDGFYDVDPNRFEHPCRLEAINIFSAIDLAAGGAKVLDRRCLDLAEKYRPPLEVLKSTHERGTEVTYSPIEGYHVDGISLKEKISIVKKPSKITHNAQLKNENPRHLLFELCYERGEFAIVEGSDNAQNLHLVVIAGSGFCFFAEFKERVFETLEKLGEAPLLVSIEPTCARIVVRGEGKKLVEMLQEKLL